MALSHTELQSFGMRRPDLGVDRSRPAAPLSYPTTPTTMFSQPEEAINWSKSAPSNIIPTVPEEKNRWSGEFARRLTNEYRSPNMGLTEWGNLVRKIESEMQFDTQGGDKTIPIEFFEKYMPKKAKDEMADLEYRRATKVKNEEATNLALSTRRQMINEGLLPEPAAPKQTPEEKLQAIVDEMRSMRVKHPDMIFVDIGKLGKHDIKYFKDKRTAGRFVKTKGGEIIQPEDLSTESGISAGEPIETASAPITQPATSSFTFGTPNAQGLIPVTKNGVTKFFRPESVERMKKAGGQ